MNIDNPLRIDVISDVMCQWCVIGYRQLERALTETSTEYVLHWHPFELNPEMPLAGQNLREHLAEKYGSTDAQSAATKQRITELGAALGFEFRFADDTRMHNTFNAHQLLHWAREQNRDHDLKQAMFAAHFTRNRNVSDIKVLAEIAREVGLDTGEALAVLEEQRFAEGVRAHQMFWINQGVRGVPAIVFDSTHLVTGTQGETRLKRVLDSVAHERRTALS